MELYCDFRRGRLPNRNTEHLDFVSCKTTSSEVVSKVVIEVV